MRETENQDGAIQNVLEPFDYMIKFWLFPKLKIIMKSKHFELIENSKPCLIYFISLNFMVTSINLSFLMAD